MKIFFPIGFFYPAQTGGPNNSIYWLAKFLKRNGVDVVEVAMDIAIGKEMPRNEWLYKDYGKVMYVRTINHQFAFSYIGRSVLTAINAEIVHLTGVFAPTSFIIGLCCSVLQKKIVWSVRGEFDPSALKYNKSIKTGLIFFVKILKNINNITFHSTCEAETNYIKKLLGDKTKVIQVPNYMELPQQVVPEKGNTPYFLYIGRHHAKKGLDNLIAGISQSLTFINSNYSLLIAGQETPYTNELKKIVKQLGIEAKIKFIGEVTGKNKEKLYADAYFTILPSHTENFGNVVIESLAQGTPVIASQGTPWEILEDYGAGFWISNSIEEIKKNIDKTIQLETDIYSMMRVNGRKLSEEKFDISKNVDIWINHYKNILQNKY